jgi:dTDP-glucose 4,6-dehydratase
MKVILVTGGAGFIGSNFVKYFLKRNKNFIIASIDKQAYPSDMGRLTELENSPRYHHIKGDVCNQDLIEYVLRKYKPSWIVNFCSEPDQSKDNKRFRFSSDSSYAATHSLLEGARYIWARSSLADKRFLQISSDAVYGLTKESNEFFDEESRLSPSDPYSAIKAGADLMVEAYNKAFGMPSVILRSCNIYGPWQNIQCLIPSIIRNILADRELELPLTEPVREWMHVSDMCSAITRALFFARPGDIYNIGSGESVSEVDLASLLLRIAGKPAERLSTKGSSKHQGEACRLNSYKANCNLKWSNSYHLDEGLTDTLHWYESHNTFTNHAYT